MAENELPPHALERRIFSDPSMYADDLDALLTSLPHAMVIGDLHGILRANCGALSLFDADPLPDGGTTYEVLTARSRLAHTRSGLNLTRNEQPFAQAILGKSSACDAIITDAASGRKLALRCMGAPVWRAGQHVGAMVIYHDISDLKNVTDVLRRSNEMLNEFSAIVAHDLHEPLRMICSFLELAGACSTSNESGKAQRFLTFAAENAKRMQKLIEDLLDLTRVAQQNLTRSMVDCNSAVREVVDLIEGSLHEGHAEICVGVLPVVYADRAHLMRLFQNLIGNAVKYCRDGVPPVVHINGQRREQDTVFTVSDNGIGISPEDSQRIFAPFDRVDQKYAAPGSGLGLSICRRIVSRYRGDIWVDSNGQGCVFTFTIPHESGNGALEVRGTLVDAKHAGP